MQYRCVVCNMYFPDRKSQMVHMASESSWRNERMAKYYVNPADGKYYDDPLFQHERKTMRPATDKQKERVKELKNRPEFTPHLDWLIERITKHKALETSGGIGSLINDMKEKIREAGGIVD